MGESDRRNLSGIFLRRLPNGLFYRRSRLPAGGKAVEAAYSISSALSLLAFLYHASNPR